MLPKLSRPRILDIGCGTGVATLELARISDGDIVAVDIDEKALEILLGRAEKEDLSSRIRVMNTSMLDMEFPPNSFDIIWSEGAIFCMGFERGLRAWHDLLVPKGCLVVHDDASGLQRKVELVRACGYTTLGQFELSPTVWWNEYYVPLKNHLETLREQGSSDKRVIDKVKTTEQEIKWFECENNRTGSVFFVLRRT